MHILHLIKTSEGATWAINLLAEIRKVRKDIKFSVMIPSGGKHYNQYVQICENVIEFDYLLNAGIFSNGRIFRKAVLDVNPDIIHSWFTQTTLYARLFLRNSNIPRVFQVVGPAHLENLLFKVGDIISSQKNDYWIATSKYIYDKYKLAGVPQENIFLNYAFIDTENIVSSQDKTAAINYREKLGLAADTKIIGTASYIYPPKFYQRTGVKGHELLLDAFRLLLKSRQDVVLIIAGTTFGGDKAYEEKLKDMADKISVDKIFFTGEYKDVYETIGGFEVFIYLSKSENLGGVYESLLLRIPTISSNCGALPELVINNHTGFNVDPENTGEIVNKIIEIIDDVKLIDTHKGKKLVEMIFDKAKIRDQAVSIYESILNTVK